MRRPLSKPRLTRLALMLLVVLLAVCLGILLRVLTLDLPRVQAVVASDASPCPWCSTQLTGVVHVHSAQSPDSDGRSEDIVAAAGALGLRFVLMSEHDRYWPAAPAESGGVLLIPASETSTARGHVLTVGTTRALSEHERGANPLGYIRLLGGVTVAAHPRRDGSSFSGSFSDVDGVELASASSDLLALPGLLGATMIPVALAFLVHPELAISYLVQFDPVLFASWDVELTQRDVRGWCAADAHGHLGYNREFGTFQTVVVAEPGGRPWPVAGALLADVVVTALREGRSYCRVGCFGEVGLDFAALAEDGSAVTMGASVSRARVLRLDWEVRAGDMPLEVRLVRDGSLVMESTAARGEYQPLVPGAYRLEAWTRLPGFWGGTRRVPLLFSNAIRLTD